MSPTHASPTRLLLVTRRHALASFFRSLPGIAVEVVRPDLAGGDLEGADVVAVDVALELVARGLSDREIGAVLHLSPHTIKHHVEHLRAEVGARNRTELAAWAGRHGFYRPEADDLVPVQLER